MEDSTNDAGNINRTRLLNTAQARLPGKAEKIDAANLHLVTFRLQMPEPGHNETAMVLPVS